MPTSAPDLLAWGCNIINRDKPKSILDIGIGHGKWGFLASEYAEDRHPGQRRNVVIEGVEVFSPYISQLHTFIYDKVHNCDIRDFQPIREYDLAIMADVIEHMSKEDGIDVLNSLVKVCKHILITTPSYFLKQEPHYGNALEEHLTSWDLTDLLDYNVIESTQAGMLSGFLIGKR